MTIRCSACSSVPITVSEHDWPSNNECTFPAHYTWGIPPFDLIGKGCFVWSIAVEPEGIVGLRPEQAEPAMTSRGAIPSGGPRRELAESGLSASEAMP